MKILCIRALRGPNLFADFPVLRMTLDLEALASFQCGDTPLGRALAQMGQALDLRESAKRTESQSTSYSYVPM